MNQLPIEIIKYHILSFLDNKDILSLMMTNKFYYNGYLKDINENKLIMDRMNRINNCRKYNKNISIILDRMYELHPYHEENMVIILVRVIHPKRKNINLEVIIEYTYNGWKKVKRNHLCLNEYFEYDKSCESLWLIPLKNTINLWFAIAVIDKENNQTLWDNNNGWNYCFSSQYHYIPEVYSLNKYPLMDFYYNHHTLYRHPPIYEWVDYKSLILEKGEMFKLFGME